MNATSHTVSDAVRQILDARVIAVLRIAEHTHALDLATVLSEHGVPVMEFTLDHPDALASITRTRTHLESDALVGAGTVTTPDQVSRCADAGARFCVSPHTDPHLIEKILAHGMVPIPGFLTPTEANLAAQSGAELLKLFPAAPLTTDYLRALRGPFSSLNVVPTGGVRHDDLAPWFAAGAAAVGLGSDLVPRNPGPSDLDAIGERASVVRAQIDALASTE